MPEQRVEGREQGRAVRDRPAPARAAERGQVAGQDEPAGVKALDRDLGHHALGHHRAQGGAARGPRQARVGEIPAQIELGGRAHGVERALHVPAEELLGRHRLHRGGCDRTLEEIVALLEVPARVDGEHAGHPEIVDRVLDGPPVPPAAAAASRAARLHFAVAHRAIGADGLGHQGQQLGIAPQPGGPAGMPSPVVEHRALPPGQHRGGHETGRVGPVLEEEPAAVDQPVEPGPVVGAEAAPDREVVGPVEHVDRIHLQPAHVLDEARQARGGEPVGARPGQVLPLQEQGGDRAEREDGVRHRPGGYQPGAAAQGVR